MLLKLRQRGKKDQPPKLLCDINMVYLRRFFFFFFFLKIPKIWVGENEGDGFIKKKNLRETLKIPHTESKEFPVLSPLV